MEKKFHSIPNSFNRQVLYKLAKLLKQEMRINLDVVSFPVLDDLEGIDNYLITEKCEIENLITQNDQTGIQIKTRVPIDDPRILEVIHSDTWEEDFEQNHLLHQHPTNITFLCSLQVVDSNGDEPEHWFLTAEPERDMLIFNMSSSFNSALAKIFKLPSDRLVWPQLQPFISCQKITLSVSSQTLVDVHVQRLLTDIPINQTPNVKTRLCYPQVVSGDAYTVCTDCIFIELYRDETELPDILTIEFKRVNRPLFLEYYPKERGVIINSYPHRVAVVGYEKSVRSKKDARKLILSNINGEAPPTPTIVFWQTEVTGLRMTEFRIFMLNYTNYWV